MPVSDRAIDTAIDLIADVPGLQMNVDDLAEDVVLMAVTWPDEVEFRKAAAATERALRQLVAAKVDSTPLKYGLEGWYSYHYQHSRGQGQRADMRIAYQPTKAGIRVRAFGHRDISSDFYERIASSRQDKPKVSSGA